MANIIPVSSTLRMTLNAGNDGDRLIKKSVSVRNVNDAASADSVLTMTDAFGELLEFPVETVKKYSVSLYTRG